jgi:hypothetical protein
MRCTWKMNNVSKSCKATTRGAYSSIILNNLAVQLACRGLLTISAGLILTSSSSLAKLPAFDDVCVDLGKRPDSRAGLGVRISLHSATIKFRARD